MTKAEIEKKKAIARELYFAGMDQKEIADKVGVSAVTVSKWVNSENWKTTRAAKNITRPELINKILLAIDKIITDVGNSDDPKAVATLGDKLAKLSSSIERLDKRANVVQVVEIMMEISERLQEWSHTDADLTVEFIKKVNTYHDRYIKEIMAQPK